MSQHAAGIILIGFAVGVPIAVRLLVALGDWMVRNDDK